MADFKIHRRLADIDVLIGRNFKRWREGLSLDSGAVAEHLGIGLEQLAAIEAGSVRLSAHQMMTLYHEWGLEPCILFTGIARSVPPEMPAVDDGEFGRLRRAFEGITETGLRHSVIDLVENIARAR